MKTTCSGHGAAHQRMALTRWELVALLAMGSVGAFMVLLMLLPLLAYRRQESNNERCKANLAQISRSLSAYTQSYSGYYPFTWSSTDIPDAATAATSLGLLYPTFVDDAAVFRCPSTDERPKWVWLTESWPEGWGCARRPAADYGSGRWILKDSSYGYDPRLAPTVPGNHVVFGDMDGTWEKDHDTPTQNHEAGQNVLYADGHVAWAQTNHVSNDPLDNIFAEDAWNADTDSFLVRGDRGLGRSFDKYPALHRR